jgi:hypothetical protein
MSILDSRCPCCFTSVHADADECPTCGLAFKVSSDVEQVEASTERFEAPGLVDEAVAANARWFLLSLHVLIGAITVQQKTASPTDVAAWVLVHWLLLLWLPIGLLRLTRWTRRISSLECALLGASGAVFGLCTLLASSVDVVLGLFGAAAYPFFLVFLAQTWGEGPPSPNARRNVFVVGLVGLLPVLTYALAVLLGCAGVVSCHSFM